MAALQNVVYPGTGGSSGIVLRKVSSLFFSLSTEQSVRSLMDLGRTLNILGPLYPRLAVRRVLILAGACVGSAFLVQRRPVLEFEVAVILLLFEGFGTKFSNIFQV